MTLQGKVLLVTRLQDTASAIQQLKQLHPQILDVTVLTVTKGSDLAQPLTNTATDKSNVFDAVVSFNEQLDQLSTELAAISPLLIIGGSLQLFVSRAHDDKKDAIVMDLMIGGFVDIADKYESSPLFPEFSGAVCFSGKKQTFDSAAIPLARKTMATQFIKKWTVVPDETSGYEQDDDIIDEDTLLDNTDEVLQAAKVDCNEVTGGKKRACKNCTCGLKDKEDKPVMSEKELNTLVSGCGNCYKGDAFRCGSCPFLGKPAFKPGMEKVLLNLDNSDDI
ncbi:anamorsin isoform x1 [Plasmopara halstedii]|uniref:Anamorsin homolog n=1 Tax=Plasmopara halstedii TaxID=4781 RepID=A0A0N7L4Q5_PLAHL|nr:anamorsin isoform x1 [Plasmopara halstedii]CEG39331.1 anamorsin isoform x1 [Plasmopara halstedii]|eukprot:XP_024575700.1 anamorsin isoform x1 [Plasmopara halstedii]